MKITYLPSLLILFMLFTVSIHGQNQDCSSSTKLCEKGTFHFALMKGMGSVDESQESLLCSNNFKEENSHWIRWEILKEGNLSFVLDPIDSDDDLDFVLFKINDDCEDIEEIRCMASGRTYNDIDRNGQPCEGTTGLSFSSLDEFEKSGCKFNDDNFLKFLSTDMGEEYVLFVNNFSSSKGFSITFEGTSEFRKYNSCFTTDTKDIVNILKVFPNPAMDEISVVYNKKESKPIDIQILNLEGQVIWTKQTLSSRVEQQENISVEDLFPGTYLVRIIQGDFSSTKSFIKQ